MDAYPVSAEAGTMEEIQTMASNIPIVCKIDGTGTTDLVNLPNAHLSIQNSSNSATSTCTKGNNK